MNRKRDVESCECIPHAVRGMMCAMYDSGMPIEDIVHQYGCKYTHARVKRVIHQHLRSHTGEGFSCGY